MVACMFNSRTSEAEVGDSLQLGGQLRLHSKTISKQVFVYTYMSVPACIRPWRP